MEDFLLLFLQERSSHVRKSIRWSRRSCVLPEMHPNFSMYFTMLVVALSGFVSLLCSFPWLFLSSLCMKEHLFAEFAPFICTVRLLFQRKTSNTYQIHFKY